MAAQTDTRNLPALSRRSFAKRAALALPFLTAGGLDIARAAGSADHPDAQEREAIAKAA